MDSIDGLKIAFGQVYREHRQEIGISQERLADKIGVNRTYIYVIENGIQNPSLEAIFRLAEGIGVPPEQLIAETRARLEQDKE